MTLRTNRNSWEERHVSRCSERNDWIIEESWSVHACLCPLHSSMSPSLSLHHGQQKQDSYYTYMIRHPNSQPCTQTHTTFCAQTMINTIDMVASSEVMFHVPGRSFLIFSTTYINLKCLHTPLGLIPDYQVILFSTNQYHAIYGLGST